MPQEELTDSYSKTLPYVLMDVNDEPVVNELISANVDSIYVVIPVLLVKEVPLDLEFNGFNSATNENMSYSINPATIEISGSPSKINSTDRIVVATIDLTGFEKEFDGDFEINMPSGITNVSNQSTAEVSVRISGLSTRKITVKEFSAANLTPGHNVSFVTTSLDVVIRGERELIDDIDASDIVIEADLTSLRNAVGTYTVPAIITVGSGDGIDAVGEYVVTVTITQE